MDRVKQVEVDVVYHAKERVVGMPEKKTWTVDPSYLLCPNVPKPMHGIAPRVVLGGKWWDVTRKAAYRSNVYHCIACGVEKLEAQFKPWLEGHEFYDIDYQAGRMVYVKTVPLCHACHNFIHDGRMEALAAKGMFSRRKQLLILARGHRLLADAGLHRPTHEEREAKIFDMLITGGLAQWSDWRLVIGRKQYKPKFKTEAMWKKAMG